MLLSIQISHATTINYTSLTCSISNFNTAKWKILKNSFNNTCKKFTYLIANKHWLQDYVFMNHKHTERVTKMITYLQAAATRLQTIQVRAYKYI